MGKYPIRLVLSDWSGTLSDDRRPIWKVGNMFLARYCLPRLTFEEWHELNSRHGTASTDSFLRIFGIDLDPTDVRESFRKYYSEVTSNGTKPEIYSGARVGLMWLKEKGIPVGVISTHPQESILQESADYGVSECISAVKGNSPSKKRDLYLLCEESGVHPAEAMYVGDMLPDIEAAKSIGAMPVAVTCGYTKRGHLMEKYPDVDMLDDFSFVPELIE